MDRPWLPQSPLPTWHSQPVAERSFCPSVSSSIAITRQLHEHMEDAWQLLDTDAGLCNALSPSAASECFSGCLDVFVPACGRGVLCELLGCETLGDWYCWACRIGGSLRLSLPFSYSSVSFNCSLWVRMMSSWPGGRENNVGGAFFSVPCLYPGPRNVLVAFLPLTCLSSPTFRGAYQSDCPITKSDHIPDKIWT